MVMTCWLPYKKVLYYNMSLVALAVIKQLVMYCYIISNITFYGMVTVCAHIYML